MSIARVTVSKITPLEFAEAARSVGLSATVWTSWGASEWGVEEGATAEFATENQPLIVTFVTNLLRDRGEEAAYVVIDGSVPMLWYADGRAEDV